MQRRWSRFCLQKPSAQKAVWAGAPGDFIPVTSTLARLLSEDKGRARYWQPAHARLGTGSRGRPMVGTGSTGAAPAPEMMRLALLRPPSEPRQTRDVGFCPVSLVRSGSLHPVATSKPDRKLHLGCEPAVGRRPGGRKAGSRQSRRRHEGSGPRPP